MHENSTAVTLTKEDGTMKKPYKSTLNFLRDFARAYIYQPGIGALVAN